jgi:hypothetical protein
VTRRGRFAALAVLSGTVALEGWGAAGVGSISWSDSGNIATSAGDPVTTRGAAYSIADARSVDAPLAVTIASVALKGFHLKLPEPAVTLAALSAADAMANPNPSERRLQLASVSPFDPAKEYPGTAVPPVENPKDCLGIETCIDEYLWSLYERTHKVDTNKVSERIKVTVKKNGKTRTVMKTTTKYVVADFTWKDPAAAQRIGMPLSQYVIGGMDRGFKLKLYRALRAMEDAGLMPGITSAFRDDYRQTIASGNKAASDSSYHGGSRRGGYGHGLAADLVSVKGETRLERFGASEELWKWIDAHEKELGIARPYLDRDPPHVAPIDGKEFADKRGRVNVQHAGLTKKHQLAKRNDPAATKRAKPAKPSKVSSLQNAASVQH